MQMLAWENLFFRFIVLLSEKVQSFADGDEKNDENENNNRGRTRNGKMARINWKIKERKMWSIMAHHR